MMHERAMNENPVYEGASIEVRNLLVRYGKLTALDGISLRVEPGEVYALLGRNGAGKSSLVRCLLGQQKPDAGEVRLLGRNSWRHRTRLMERIGVVPETPDAPPSMTVKQLASFNRSLYPQWDGEGLEKRLRRFDVPFRIPFGRLSRGQRAQVMIALALAPVPDLLVLDDPTLGLDVVARKAVFEELVVELADRGTTVFLTSHDLPGIEAMASRVALLLGGKMLLDEDLEDLKLRFRRFTFRRKEGLGDRRADGTDLLAEFEPLDVRSRGRGVEALVAQFHEEPLARLRAVKDVEDLEVSPVPLEDIVIALTGEAVPTSGAEG